MTIRNTDAAMLKTVGRSLRRIAWPFVLCSTTIVGAAAIQHGQLAIEPTTTSQVAGPSAVAGGSDSVRRGGLGQEDPALSMPALRGFATFGESTVQVLPSGNVPATPITLGTADDAVNATNTHWLTNADPTTLWSGPNAGDAAFTDLPASSYLRIDGPENSGRWPVYYVGDGLLRRPGNGWVDATSVASVDSPPPGTVAAVDAEASQPLPVWVQAHRATRLWSGPDSSAVQLTDLPQWTFLRVAGVSRGGRVLVNYAGDYATREPGVGWVDDEAVGPAGDPGVWVTNHRATALWSGTDASAARFTDLPQWSKLQIVPGAPADADRLEVRFFGDGTSRMPGTAWIARADVGPITPPVPLPALASAGQIESHTFVTEDDFINTIGPAAQSSFKRTGVPASVTVAQAILESDWGRSRLTRQGNNLFGIKSLNAPGPAGVITMATWEHIGGDVVVQAPFKAYYTLEQSIDDHGRFFVVNHRYANAVAVNTDPKAFAQAIQADGYATDPNYASKLIRLMDKYNLYRFDQ